MRFKSLLFLFALCLTLTNCDQNDVTVADELRTEVQNPNHHVYVIERDIPGAGELTAEDLKNISQASCKVLDQMEAEEITWLHSYVTADKVYCVYSAASEELIQKHANEGGFPANAIEQVATVIDPKTAE